MRDYHEFNPDRLSIDLTFSEKESFTASIQVR
ncbi:hypothetical protein [Bacillus sp. EB600]